jgi:hypothetical protein
MKTRRKRRIGKGGQLVVVNKNEIEPVKVFQHEEKQPQSSR